MPAPIMAAKVAPMACINKLVNRVVTIHSAHGTICITILGVRYNTYHDILNNILNETEIQLTDLFLKHEFSIIVFVVHTI